jgi:hypothetical protein
VLEWLALDDESWRAWISKRLRNVGARPFDAAAFAYSLRYPWERPAGSFALRGGEVTLLDDLPLPDREALVREFASERYPLVSFGANGAPARLQERFAEFSEPADRDVLVLSGWLHEVDVCAQPAPTPFGWVPGVLIASPGTAVRASVLWLTPTQLTQLVKAELSYRFGRLDRAHFLMDEAGVDVEDLFAFVSRIGAMRVGGEPIALAAVPATGRSIRAMTQEQLLETIGALALGRPTSVEEMGRILFADPLAFVEKARALALDDALKLPVDHWTPYPASHTRSLS